MNSEPFEEIQASLKSLKERLHVVEDEKERIKIRETIKEMNFLLSDKQEVRMESRVESRQKSEKQSLLRMQRKKLKMEKNLQKLYLFYVQQFPTANGHFEKRTIENCDMNLNMFMVFVKQFNILGQEQRKPTERNDLELKRRGVISKIEDHVTQNLSQISRSPTKLDSLNSELPDYSMYLEKVKQGYVSKYNYVASKHRWWNEEDEFYRYYKPQNAEEVKQTHKILDTMSLMQIFKKNTHMGKSARFEHFKKLLSVIAQHVYPDVNPEQSDLNLRFQIEVLQLHKTKKMKSHFKNLHHAFNITDKVGFRYDSPKQKVREELPHSWKPLPQSTKILTKYFKRATEMEQIEQKRSEHLAKFHGNVFTTRFLK